MKIINGKQLGFMPDGTVFSDIVDDYFEPDGANGDMNINGLNIMCGHGTWCPVESGRFNGVLHMLGYVSCYGTYVEADDDYWDTITDTDSNNYTKNDWVVVYEREDINKIINNLLWALNGCKTDEVCEMVYLTKEEYEKLVEYKHMYEGLCK